VSRTTARVGPPTPFRRRITLALPSLAAGGAERVGSLLAGAWAEQGYDVTVITLAGRDTDFFVLPPAVRRIALRRTGGTPSRLAAATRVLGRIGAFRSALRNARPDVVVSFLDVINVLVLLATRGLGQKVVVSERTDPRMAPLARVWRLLRSVTYRWADLLVVQTQSVADAWAGAVVGPSRVRVIPNPHAVSSARTTAARRPRIVAIGRLATEKGFDLLIDAFAQISETFPEWDLVIFGEGDERPALVARAAASGAGARIALPGHSRAVAEDLASSSIFVLSSRFEGFPNALLEAMASGAAVVSTDCKSGPSELITAGIDGVLVPVDDLPALSAALEHLMRDGELRERLGRAAHESARRFSLDRVAARWNSVLDEVVPEQRA
jgi:GalNAc-alpha-(1->4)-GalNAc-alpha-(1->3)-diNAcBac-PP-undecaprenol alpha-1,4-N-acetyl-D-galactosaminyltransferase